MKPAAFEYSRPAALAEALDLLADRGDDAAVLAGGQSLVPMMNLRLAQPGLVVDVNELAELAYVREEGGGLAVGALARQRDVELSPEARRLCPLAVEALRFVGNPQVRNRGTVCGNLAHADPSSELPAVMVACGASIVLARRSGRRSVPAEAFFLGAFETAREPDELVVEARVPAASGGWGFEELAPSFGAHPLVAAAAAGGRVALSGLAGAPVVVSRPEEIAGDGFKASAARELARRALERAGRRP